MARECPHCNAKVSVLLKCMECGGVFCEKCCKDYIFIAACPFCGEKNKLRKL